MLEKLLQKNVVRFLICGFISAQKSEISRKSIVINTVEYNLPLLYYVQAAEVNKKHSLTLEWKKKTNMVFKNGDVIINCDSTINKKLGEEYITQLLHRSSSCKTLVIQNKKS
jgi:hypothetical protein